MKPIIRWQQETYDGTGYSDGIKGEEISLAAQVIGIVDVYDALTTGGACKQASVPVEALRRSGVVRERWRPDVYQAFPRALPLQGPPAFALASYLAS